MQAPELARPARGTIASSLASWDLGASSLARGSAALPSPFVVPTERGAPGRAFLPAYSAEQGLTEWGMGWAATLSIRRFRELGAIDFATDSFASPWGVLAQGLDGAHYARGLQPRVRLWREGDDWHAADSQGTRYTFSNADSLVTTAGTYEWWLSEVRALTGEQTLFEYEPNSSGRRFLRRVTYGGRAGVPQVEVGIEYQAAPFPFVDRRSGTAVLLDRRVSRVRVGTWQAESHRYQERYRYDLEYTESPAGVAYYLASVQRSFAGGESEPASKYHYHLGESDAAGAVMQEAPALSSYLQRYGYGSLAPSRAAYLDVDRDGRVDLESAFDHELARHTDSGFAFEALPRDGTESADCRPARSLANAPRTLVRLEPGESSLRTLAFRRTGADTLVRQCDRQGHVESSLTLTGDWTLGATTRLADVDRDLRPDLLRLQRGRLESRISTADGRLGYGPVQQQSLIPAVEPSRAWIIDLTGDNLADVVAVANSAIHVWPGLGNGRFESAAEVLPARALGGEFITSLENMELSFVDANRDGLTDLLLSRGAVLRLLTHRGFELREVLVPAFRTGVTWDGSYPIAVDLTGTGEEQAIVTRGDAAYTIAFTSPGAGLLDRAEDGKGGVLEFGYERGPASPGVVTRPPLLTHLHSEDAGRGAADYAFSHDEPVFHSLGEYLLGYRTVRRTGPLAIDEVRFHHDDVQVGLPLLTTHAEFAVPDVSRYERADYEVAEHQGLTYLRPTLQRFGVQIAGSDVPDWTKTMVSWSRDGLCPSEVRVEGPHGTSSTSVEYSEPGSLREALHCLPAAWSDVETHPARHELDQSVVTRITRTDEGLVQHVEQTSGGQTLVLQDNVYDERQRLVQTGAPGKGMTLAEYEPTSGDLLRLELPTGVVRRAPVRSSLTGAVLRLDEDRGGSVWRTEFAYDALERLSASYDNVGASSSTLPDETLQYGHASADSPASVTTATLWDGAASGYARRAEWFAASGAPLATGTWVSEGWSFSAISQETRSLGEVRLLWREPLAVVDPREVALGELFAGGATRELGRMRTSSFALVPHSNEVLQQGTEREVAQSLAPSAEGIVRETRMNGALQQREVLDGNWQVTSSTDAGGGVTRVTRDARGRITDVSLPGGAEQSVRYDGFGRVSRIERTGVGRVDHTYDAVGQLVSTEHRDESGSLVRSTRREYDATGREVERVHRRAEDAQELTFRFGYDGDGEGGARQPGQLGRLTRVAGPDYVREQVHGANGWLASSSVRFGAWRTVEDKFAYFEDGVLREQRRVVRGADGTELLWTTRTTERDEYGREIRALIASNDEPVPRELYRLEYDQQGRLAQIALRADESDGVVVSQQYDEATGSLRGYQQVAADWALAVDTSLSPRGLVNAERVRYQLGTQAPVALDREYTHDARDFLSIASVPGEEIRYDYDASGLLEGSVDPLGAHSRVGGVDRLAGGGGYEWDTSGRLVLRGEVRLRYDASGQLGEADAPGLHLEFRYDEQGQRVLKWRNGTPVRAYIGETVLTAEGLAEPLRVAGRMVAILEDGVLVPLPVDPRGTVLLQQVGVQSGQELAQSTPYGVRSALPSVSELVDFAGKGRDPDIGLVRMGARDYDPVSGQFTTPDALFLENIEKCVRAPVECNLYSYAGNDPVTFVDRQGTEAEPWYGGLVKAGRFAGRVIGVVGAALTVRDVYVTVRDWWTGGPAAIPAGPGQTESRAPPERRGTETTPRSDRVAPNVSTFPKAAPARSLSDTERQFLEALSDDLARQRGQFPEPSELTSARPWAPQPRSESDFQQIGPGGERGLQEFGWESSSFGVDDFFQEGSGGDSVFGAEWDWDFAPAAAEEQWDPFGPAN